MFKHLFSHRRRQAPRYPAGLDERRVSAPGPAADALVLIVQSFDSDPTQC